MNKILFSDIDFSMNTHPITKDIMRLTNEESIKRAAKNLLLTNYFECFFNSPKGSPIRGLLFEEITPITKITVERAVIYQLSQYEPRIVVESVTVQTPEPHTINITVAYYTTYTKTRETFSFPIKRTR